MKQKICLAMIVMALVLSPVASGALQPESPETIISGTLVKLDLNTLRGLLTTDLGKPIFFEIPKAYLFENVMVGARITLQLDSQGRAMKVMDTSLPDVVMPAVMPSSGGPPAIQPLATNMETLPAESGIPSR